MNILKDHFWTMHAWIAIAVSLTLLEVLVGSSFFLLCVAAACTVVGLLLGWMPALVWQSQVFIFACVALGSVGFWWHYLRGHLQKPKHDTLNRRAEQYIGRTFTLSEAIVNGRGKIRVDDSSWQVEGPELAVGTTVEIIGVAGVLLKARAKVS